MSARDALWEALACDPRIVWLGLPLPKKGGGNHRYGNQTVKVVKDGVALSIAIQTKPRLIDGRLESIRVELIARDDLRFRRLESICEPEAPMAIAVGQRFREEFVRWQREEGSQAGNPRYYLWTDIDVNNPGNQRTAVEWIADRVEVLWNLYPRR